MHAIVADSKNLENRAQVVNAGRTDGTYFYVNNKSVTVDNPYHKMDEEQQRSLLEWFLSDRHHNIINN